MRFGGRIFATFSSPDEWVAAVKAAGYSAANCPLEPGTAPDEIRAYADAAAAADVVIAEVGSWCNPISPDEATRRAALDKCKARLALADAIGARCCVNIAGSYAEQWDGPAPANFSDEAFDAIVASVREIIDEAAPTRTFYTLEPMPWVPPDSVESYERLIDAIDRERFAVHFDPVNIVTSPRVFHENGAMIREFLRRLGPRIRSCHAKDTRLEGDLTVHLNEVRPGTGSLDYATYLTELDRLDPDTPLIIEHLKTEEDFVAAADHIRTVAGNCGVVIR
jgi:sugar phosphate isomerase/epimerase